MLSEVEVSGSSESLALLALRSQATSSAMAASQVVGWRDKTNKTRKVPQAFGSESMLELGGRRVRALSWRSVMW